MLRFAPSPTGDMDINSLRVALINYIVAKQRSEALLIRVEDTDKEKNIENKDQEILLLLEKFGIEYSQVVYQSDNIKYHQQIVAQLLIDKKAFACFCSDEIIEAKKAAAKKDNKPYKYDGACENLSDAEVLEHPSDFVVRVKKPEGDDLNGIDSFIIMQKNKDASYNFACSMDDMLSDISMVIRSEKYLSDTPKQIYLRELLGYDKTIEYLHLPSILNGKDTPSVISLLEQGFVPEAITNYLLFMGNKTPKEIFSLAEAIEWFDISNIADSPVEFDMEMLRYFNREQIVQMDALRLSQFIGFSDSEIGEVAKLYTQEGSTINEIKPKIDAIFAPKSEDEANVKIIKEAIKEIGILEEFDALVSAISERTGLKEEELSQPLRVVLTGAESGPNLKDIYLLIKNYLMEIVK